MAVRSDINLICLSYGNLAMVGLEKKQIITGEGRQKKLDLNKENNVELCIAQ